MTQTLVLGEICPALPKLSNTCYARWNKQPVGSDAQLVTHDL